MEIIIWLIITILSASLFSGIGIFAWRRKKPMWFWSGSEVSEYEISDIPAYNRENGVMWIAFSSIFWLSAFLGLFQMKIAGIILTVGCFAGIPALIIIYGKIYNKYKIM